jgi:hypothetical protein
MSRFAVTQTLGAKSAKSAKSATSVASALTAEPTRALPGGQRG